MLEHNQETIYSENAIILTYFQHLRGARMKIIVISNVTDAQPYEKELEELYQEIFASKIKFLSSLFEKKHFHLVIAIKEGKLIGFKAGYEQKSSRFYSWIGGVSPLHRGQGIAGELMKAQHTWCHHHGYTAIQTKTKNRWKQMLILNLKHGFNVIGTYTDETGEPKIILEKKL